MCNVKPEAVSLWQVRTAFGSNVNVADPPFRSEYGPFVGCPFSPGLKVPAFTSPGRNATSNDKRIAATAAIANVARDVGAARAFDRYTAGYLYESRNPSTG
jgi:hypothetical protein